MKASFPSSFLLNLITFIFRILLVLNNLNEASIHLVINPLKVITSQFTFIINVIIVIKVINAKNMYNDFHELKETILLVFIVEKFLISDQMN